MADTAPIKQTAKKSASPLDAATDEAPAQKKQKQTDDRDTGPATRDRIRALGFSDDDLAFLDADHTRDERKDIMDDINAGTHVLVLEHNNATNAKCRADKCLVEPLHYNGDKIHSAYRINLQELRPSNEHWSARVNPVRRFFHVSCIEGIGIDLAEHLCLQAAIPDRAYAVIVGVYQVSFHPAIEDWVKNKGKTFDAEVYKDSEYQVARKEYKSQMLRRSSFGPDNQRNLGNPLPEPVQPNISNFIPAYEEMMDRRLSEVLLDLMGGGHLAAPIFSAELRVKVLEVMGRVPEYLSWASIEAKLEAAKERKAAKAHAGDGQGADNEPHARRLQPLRALSRSRAKRRHQAQPLKLDVREQER